MKQIPILDVGGVLISTSILTEYFCCDLDACGGACCIEGDAGAPVTVDEIGEMEHSLDAAWPLMSAQAQAVVDRQGVAYTDPEGELVTSIVGGKDCVFTYYNYPPTMIEGLPRGCCLCALEKVFRDGRSRFAKPISCALYPIREKHFSGGLIGLNYHRWAICDAAIRKGREENLRLYQFLREPLIRRFGQAWYDELCEVAHELELQSLQSSEDESSDNEIDEARSM
ncbi:MAG: DUF3109 family protein [Bacteroidales bacterium]|nr:DUF3109 family protein [Bacteroidales bacterium]